MSALPGSEPERIQPDDFLLDERPTDHVHFGINNPRSRSNGQSEESKQIYFCSSVESILPAQISGHETSCYKRIELSGRNVWAKRGGGTDEGVIPLSRQQKRTRLQTPKNAEQIAIPRLDWFRYSPNMTLIGFPTEYRCTRGLYLSICSRQILERRIGA